jgi:hypothetical protein
MDTQSIADKRSSLESARTAVAEVEGEDMRLPVFTRGGKLRRVERGVYARP